jgi:hypothetical protein
MKWRGFLFAMISALSLIGFGCGRAGSNAPATETQSKETNAAGLVSTGAKPADGSTNDFVKGPFNLAMRDWSGQVRRFVESTQSKAHQVRSFRNRQGTMFLGEIDDQDNGEWGFVSTQAGTRQVGEWRGGQPYRVAGVYVAADGTREEGTWNDPATPSGGTINWKDGRTYKGEWRVAIGSVDLPDGMGTMNWPDGRRYTGHFLDGKMDGVGKMTYPYPDNRVEEGMWMQGTFMGASPTSGPAATPTTVGSDGGASQK